MAILQGIKLKDDETAHQLDYEKGIGNKPTIITSYEELEDKPFYAEQGEPTELLTNQSLTFTYFSDLGAFTNFITETIGSTIPLVSGQKYVVEWDSDKYECVAKDISFGGMESVGIGNLSIIGEENTNEPFILYSVPVNNNFTGIVSLVDSAEATHTVHVYQENETVHQLDSKYVDAYTKEETKNLIANAITTALNTEV